MMLLALLLTPFARATVIDRIAVIVGNGVIKDSDIDRDIRVTSFLNGAPAVFDAAARKQAASRLIDQAFIRREIRLGQYPTATPADADRMLAEVKADRFRSETEYRTALSHYRLTNADIRAQLQWQLSVLRFIEQRFRPAVLISDEEIEKYRRAHSAALARDNGGRAMPPETAQEKIRDVLTGERVNQLFYEWLDQQRKEQRVIYREESLP